ncbi:hypothetical protein UY3_06042 [Chelonia mydas]|uniref:Uncharacterized protein n=1 Tax=Chelonia mydas TaxID=8469 RepID=M7BHU3_CHEMY|nr:hypothetical protein UY3_06042 [Chelonia mydas]
MEAALQPPGPEHTTLAQASWVRSAPEPSRDLAPAKHRKLSAPECQIRPWHHLSSHVRPPAQPKGRRGRSPHKRPVPPKAPSADKSGKAAVPAPTPVVPAAQAPPSPDLSELSADDGLEGITDQPSTPGTFEAAKELAVGGKPPSRMGRTLRHPYLGCRRVTLASSSPTAKGVERKYFAPSKDYEFLFCHSSPCSLVVSVVNKRERHGQQATAPKAQDAKHLDLFGRKVFSSGGLQLRIANE